MSVEAFPLDDSLPCHDPIVIEHEVVFRPYALLFKPFGYLFEFRPELITVCSSRLVDGFVIVEMIESDDLSIRIFEMVEEPFRRNVWIREFDEYENVWMLHVGSYKSDVVIVLPERRSTTNIFAR